MWEIKKRERECANIKGAENKADEKHEEDGSTMQKDRVTTKTVR